MGGHALRIGWMSVVNEEDFIVLPQSDD